MSDQPSSPDPRPAAASDADDDPASPPDGSDGREGASRGFLGRLLGAFSADPGDGDNGPQVQGPPAPTIPGVLNLRRLRVDDVAIPKGEIVAAAADTSLDELVTMFRDHGFSRIPVYGDTLDRPLGMIHLKDLALRYGFGAGEGGFALKPMLRPLLYVPPSMPLSVLLAQMQRERIHMALVIDEYGGVDGLVTIEDLIEQVVGEIEDEHDEGEGRLWSQETAGQWLVEARAEIGDVEKATGLALLPGELEDEVDTLGGLVVLLAGRVPAVGEIVTHPGGAELEVVEADPRRVKLVRLRAPAGA